MRRHLLAFALAPTLALAAPPAAADSPDFRGTLPSPAGLAAAGPGALAVLVQAVVIGQNCDGRRTTEEQWFLLNASADAIADRMGLSPQDYDDRFWRPAFRLLDEARGCARHGWALPKALGWLATLGGRTGH